MTHDTLALVALFGMAIVTYATRAGGALMMSFVPMTPRLQVFLRHLASSVMVAIVVGAAVRGDVAAWLAIAMSMVVMVATRNTFASIFSGMAIAAAWRAVVGL